MFDVLIDLIYGVLLCQDFDQLQVGVCVDVVDDKCNLMDFVLWKMLKEGELSWLFLWGVGCFGWYIECLVMNCKQLGNYFDIYGGGLDLMFLYYENEIVQFICVYDGQYVNYWMYLGMVMVDCEKMFKLLGNFFIVCDVLKYYDVEIVCYFLMLGYYCSQLNYSEENLKQVCVVLECFYIVLCGIDKIVVFVGGEVFEVCFIEVMDDDFNILEVYFVLFDMVCEVNCLKVEDMVVVNVMVFYLCKFFVVLGLLE